MASGWRIGRTWGVACGGLLVAIGGWQLAGGAAPPPPGGRTEIVIPAPGTGPEARADEETGLEIRLSDAEAVRVAQARLRSVAGEPLTAEEIAELLSRLPALEGAPGDQVEFAFPPQTLPPPRPGEQIEETFPPPAPVGPPPGVEPGPLTVIQHQPEGDIPLAAELSLTFSQPIVPVTSVEELAAGDLPLRLSPEVAGNWRWLGTQTLLFRPAKRFPMATRYTVEVPAGLVSVAGAKLGEAFRWSFATPAPRLVEAYPRYTNCRRDPLCFVSFDQAIDPEAVLAKMRLEVDGRPGPALQLADPEEIEAHPEVRVLVARAMAGRWVAFRPQTPLGPEVQVVVKLGPGLPSTEGPLVTDDEQSYDFRTHGPLKIVEHRCAWGDECRPGSPWIVRFSNRLDPTQMAGVIGQIEPAVAGLKVEVQGETLWLHAATKPRAGYRVTLLERIVDEFGQTLGRDQLVRFSMGAEETQLHAPVGPLTVLDPASGPKLSVYSCNYAVLRVRAYAVSPGDWPAYIAWMQTDPVRAAIQARPRGARGGRQRGAVAGGERVPEPPGREVVNRAVPVQGPADQLVETILDFADAAPEGLGQLLVVVEPEGEPKPDQPWPVVRTWLQATRLGLAALVDEKQVAAWVNQLSDGAPLAEVELSLEPGGPRAKSGADGVARIELPPRADKPLTMLVARRGKDVAFLPRNAHWGWYGDASGWYPQPPSDGHLWYVFDDRKLYRPGETVHLKGWLRHIAWGPRGDLAPAAEQIARVQYTIRDPQGNELAQGQVPVAGWGGFDLTFEIPSKTNLGDARIELAAQTADGGATLAGHTHSFSIQEFRRPEYEVSTETAAGPFFLGDETTIAATASYFSGGGLPDAELRWQVTSTPGQFTPPGRDDFTFGRWVPWWRMWEGDGGERYVQHESRTDAAGRHRLKLAFVSLDPPRPTNVSATAVVRDVNRQEWSASSQLLVHPSAHYVGLRAGRAFIGQGEALPIEALVCDLDGRALAERPIALRLVRLEWTNTGAGWAEVEVDPAERELVSATDPVSTEFRPALGGAYRLTATIRDDRERLNETELRFWVSGGKQPPRRDVAQEEVELIPNQKEYRPGDVAEVLVRSPIAPAEAVLTVSRNGTLTSERFRLEEATHTLKIPVTAEHVPNVWVKVDLIGSAPRLDDEGRPLAGAPPRPAFAAGQLKLSIPPYDRRLQVAVAPREAATTPGAETEVALELKTAAGEPLAEAEAALVVVDEAVLALAGYQLIDPLSIFYPERGLTLSVDELRALVRLTRGDQLEAQANGGGGGRGRDLDFMGQEMMPAAPMAAAPMMADAAAEGMTLGVAVRMAKSGAAQPEPGKPIALRTNFNPLAAFVPGLVTDAAGKAVAKFKLPDNLTRYRVMAVAVDRGGRQFGTGESTITARLPLMVRPSPPRFLNYGDRCELPVVVQNQSDAELVVRLAARGTNLELTGSAGVRVTVPPQDRIEVRLPAAAVLPGRARLQLAATAGELSDAATVDFPVWTPATTEAFATYGELDEGAVAQLIRTPGDVVPQFGGLELSTSSTALSALTDAVIYLTAYPFECAEQVSSRVISIVALRDVLAAFKAEGLPPSDELAERLKADLTRLQGLQNPDGGFGFWRSGYQSWPYLSIHVAHALVRCRQKDVAVQESLWNRARDYLVNVRERIPQEYSVECRRMLEAYALYVRHLAGEDVADAARGLYREQPLESWPLEGLGWLLSTLAGDEAVSRERQAIRRHLANRASQTASTAQFTTNYGEQSYLVLHSDRRTDAILLEALMADEPKNPLIPKLVRGLLGHRVKGRWGNTQENCFVLLALDGYFRKYESATPDFVARAWLGERYAAEQRYRGRTTEQRHLRLPLGLLGSAGQDTPLVLAKEGPGRLYYRLGMRYAPQSLQLAPADYGFAVQRRYTALDDPADVHRDADGTWHLKAGASVRVELEFVAPSRRYHVALVDPLPAGLEAVNPALAMVAERPIPRGSKSWSEGAVARGAFFWPWWHWHEHQNLRDDRVEAFASLVWGGVYTYSYEARATTPGSYVVPPTKVEEMYAPETFGRSGTDRVVVE